MSIAGLTCRSVEIIDGFGMSVIGMLIPNNKERMTKVKTLPCEIVGRVFVDDFTSHETYREEAKGF